MLLVTPFSVRGITSGLLNGYLPVLFRVFEEPDVINVR